MYLSAYLSWVCFSVIYNSLKSSISTSLGFVACAWLDAPTVMDCLLFLLVYCTYSSLLLVLGCVYKWLLVLRQRSTTAVGTRADAGSKTSRVRPCAVSSSLSCWQSSRVTWYRLVQTYHADHAYMI